MEALKRFAVALNYQQEVLIGALMLTRTLSVVLMTPWLGGKLIPPEIKMAIGVLVTIIVWPIAHTTLTGAVPMTPIPFLLLMCKEVFIGFAIGFAASHIFYAVEVGGRIIDTVRGSSMAEVMVPQSGERATPVGDLFYQLLIVLFMTLGGHRVFFQAYCHSFEVLPLDKQLAYGNAMGPFIEVVVRTSGEVMFTGVLISAPVIAATFLADLVFGILNRVAPQLNAYFLSMPVKAMAGIAMILVAMEPLTWRMMQFVTESLQLVEKVIDLFLRGSY